MKLDQGVIPEACLRLRRAIVNMENQVRVLVGAFGIKMISFPFQAVHIQLHFYPCRTSTQQPPVPAKFSVGTMDVGQQNTKQCRETITGLLVKHITLCHFNK